MVGELGLSIMITVVIVALISPLAAMQGQALDESGNAPIWPMDGGNAQHNGISDQSVSNRSGDLLWNISLGSVSQATPSIGADGTIYVPCIDSHLYAIDRNGHVRWAKLVQEFNGQSPAIGKAGTIFLGSDGPDSTMLYAINPDGTAAWEDNPEGRILDHRAILDFTSPIVLTSNGTLLMTCGESGVNSYLFAYAPNGSLLWSVKEPNFLYTPAVGPNGEIYVGSNLGVLYSFDANGNLIWSVDEGLGRNVPGLFPSIGPDGTIYFVLSSLDDSSSPTLFAIHPNGTVAWTFVPIERTSNSQWYAISRPAIGRDGTIYLNIGESLGGQSAQGLPALMAVDPNGAMKWKCSIDTSPAAWPSINSGISGLVIDGDDRILGIVGNNLFMVSEDGIVQGQFATPGYFWSITVGANGTTYFVENGQDQMEHVWAYDGFPKAQATETILEENTLTVLLILAPVVIVSVVVILILRRP